jgi:putative addiction module killer protein
MVRSFCGVEGARERRVYFMYEIEEYVTETGESPFAEWLKGLQDKNAQSKILKRIDRAWLGNLGDWKSLENAKGVFEMREHYGAGYRIFFSFVGKKVILLLAGSDKREQDRAITRAKQYLEDYQRRIKP